jgi:hypothetical protein
MLHIFVAFVAALFGGHQQPVQTLQATPISITRAHADAHRDALSFN